MFVVQYIDKFKDIIYRFIYIILLCGSILFLGNKYLGIKEIKSQYLLEMFVFILIVFIFSCLKVKGKAIMLAIGLAFFLTRGATIGFDELRNILSSYTDWVMNIATNEDYIDIFCSIQLFLLVCVCFFITFVSQKSKVVRNACYVLVIIASLYLLFTKHEVTKTGVMFLMSYIVFYSVELIENFWKKERVSCDRKSYIVWLWPVWIMFMIAIYSIPTSEEPYDWATFKKIYYVMDERMTILREWFNGRNAEDFDIRMAGFSDKARIGGDLARDTKLVLSVDGSQSLGTNLYLAGVAMDSFDGHEWIQTGENYLDNSRMDAIETAYSVELRDKENKSHYLESVGLNVEYKYLSSKYYFTPLKLLVLRSADMSLTDEKSIMNPKSKSYGSKYYASYYQLNPSLAIEFAKNPVADDGKVWNDVLFEYKVDNYSFEKLLKYRQNIKLTYGQSVTLSDDMKQWVKDVTRGFDSPIEKLYAVEAALQSFTYTLTPGELPESVDSPQKYLDYFVLDKKEGYCTHFATAFTLIARYLGFPSRYVQGFCVPMKGHNTMEVTSSMAHAWSEVYFDGIGWIPYEPTAGYSQFRYTDWEDREFKPIDYSGMYDYYANLYGKKEQEQTLENEVADEPEIPEKKKTDYPVIQGIMILLISFVIIILGDMCVSRRRYKKKDNKDKLTWEIERNLYVMKKLGIEKQEYQTLGEMNRLLDDLYEKWQQDKSSFIFDYEGVIYGGKEATYFMICNARNERTILASHLGRLGRAREKYYFWRVR